MCAKRSGFSRQKLESCVMACHWLYHGFKIRSYVLDQSAHELGAEDILEAALSVLFCFL